MCLIGRVERRGRLFRVLHGDKGMLSKDVKSSVMHNSEQCPWEVEWKAVRCVETLGSG